MQNTVQILESYWQEHPAWFGRSYGEYLHLGANQELLRLMLRGLSITKDNRVLDLGCALGGNARWLASLYGCTVEGVDGFKPAILAARQLGKAQGVGELCRFVVGSVSQLPYSDGRFDLVLTADDDVEWPEVARVLAPGGHALGSIVASSLSALKEALEGSGLVTDELVDVTDYARAFYKAKEEEAKLLVAGDLMSEQDMQSLQMHTVDMYEAGAASHAMFRVTKPGEP